MLKTGLSDRGYRMCAKNWSAISIVLNSKPKAKMAEETLPRFQLLDDDQMQDLLTVRTQKRYVKFSIIFFQNRSSRSKPRF